MNSNIENLVTVCDVKDHMWLDGKPLNYNPSESPNSQDLPDIVGVTYGISILSKDDMVKHKNVITDNPYFYRLDEIESIDIDTEFDFMVAEYVYKKVNGYV